MGEERALQGWHIAGQAWQPGHGTVAKCSFHNPYVGKPGPFPSWNRDFGVTKGSGGIGLSWDIRLSPDIRL